jgi:uncharacterized protein DUF3987/bifunctional DNA primase/polymerase-like protein
MSVLQLAGRYCEMGLAVVPVPFQSKECQLTDWQTTRLSKDDLPQHFNGSPQNIAGVFGSLSGGVVVVDCDWPEAASIASQLLPRTVTYGRDSDRLTHYLVKCPDIVATVKHKLTGPNKPTDRRTAIVEILADGHQCLLPGSTHPDGEQITWAHKPGKTPITELSGVDLQRLVSRIAGAAVLLHYWDGFEGCRHDLTLALAGACLHAGWVPEDIGAVFRALLAAGDNEVRDRKKAVSDTVKQYQAGEQVTGWPTAADLLGDLAPSIADLWQLNLDPLQSLVIGSKSLVAAQVVSNWPELLPFEETTTGHRDYPIRALGGLQAVVETVAHVQQAPVGLVAQCVLAAVSTAVQGLFDVAVPHGSYPASLFLLTLGETGERKSSTDALVFKPHDEWARERLQLVAAVDDEEKQGFAPHLFFEGGTVEGLRQLLANHWPSIVCNNSDAGDFLTGHSMREGRELGTSAFFCKLWDGQIRGVMRGQDRKPITLYGRRVSLSWMVQPQHVEALVNQGTASQGLLSRLLVCYPTSLIGRRKYLVPDAANLSVLDSYNNRIKELLNTPMDMDPHSGRLSPLPLYLDAPGKALYAQLSDFYESTLADGGINQAIRDYANKAGQHLARIAGVLAAFESATTIGSDHLDRAHILLDFYLAEWRDLHPRLGALDPETQKAVALLGWLLEKAPTPFKLQDCYQYGPRICGRAAEPVRAILAELQRRGYVRALGNNQYEVRPVGVE